jgi:hypothetical protein
MKAKRTECYVSVAMNDNDRNILTTMAYGISVSRNTLMRRLVRYFLDGKISWTDLLKQSSEIPVASDPSQGGKKYIHAKLEPEECFAFARSVEEIGSTPGIVLKRLIMLYISGKIDRGDIWR